MNDQDDEKKIIDEDKSQSESENQSKVDENNQPEGVDNQKNDSIPESNQNNNENNDQTQNLDTSSDKKEENKILDNQNDEKSLELSQNNDQETTQQQTSEPSSEKKDENNGSSHEVIHKKDGRLHIYIRQDKYKGELKSKNWVGRLYHDGKQKISSSGTPNLEEAIPILEKWFDDVVAGKEKEKEIQEQPVKTEETSVQPETSTQIVNKEQTSQTTTLTEPKIDAPILNQSPEDEQENKKSKFAFLDNIKNIKFKKPSFLEKSSVSKPSLKTNELSKKVTSFFKSKIGKSAVKGEEIVGVEITNKEIRLAQVSTNKSNQWVLDKFYAHPVDLPDDANVLDNGEKLGAELTIALQKSKITTLNAAIAIPVTSAIIRVVTAPLMKEEELQKAIETNSLWENLVQLTDNLDDYSIFHQVINRNEKANTMDILFVASKLADINNYTSIIKQSNLNPVIIDVKCFALKSAVDQINQISNKTDDVNLTAVLEFGLDENYLMILYDNNPIITDIFLRGQDRKILLESQDVEEKEALVRRFLTQVKQAVQDFETKYERRIRNIKVVSDLKNVEDFLSSFRKGLLNVGFNLFDPIDGLLIPQQNKEKVDLINRSYLSSVVGLAFRKLDVFGYYKFVTAVKNINLLPNRKGMIKEKKMKAFSSFAFKGIAASVAAIYVILFGLSFWNIQSYNKKLINYNTVLETHKAKTSEQKKIKKELAIITNTLKLSKSLKSNKQKSYRVLAQVAMSVPKRIKFSSVDYDGKNKVIIRGQAATDQDILKLINNLGTQELVVQASLGKMNFKGKAGDSADIKKDFTVFVDVKG
jgi:type IV pilus assembly protein PilN